MQQVINYGANDNDSTGDVLRLAFRKIDSNFTELYSFLPGGINFGAIPYLELRLKAKGAGNTDTDFAYILQTGDLVEGFKDATEYWTTAIYNGGDVDDRANYTPLVANLLS